MAHRHYTVTTVYDSSSTVDTVSPYYIHTYRLSSLSRDSYSHLLLHHVLLPVSRLHYLGLSCHSVSRHLPPTHAPSLSVSTGDPQSQSQSLLLPHAANFPVHVQLHGYVEATVQYTAWIYW